MSDTWNQKIRVQYEVLKIIYREDSSGYTILKGKFKKYPLSKMPTAEVIIVGQFPSLLEEDEFESEGQWINHKEYGYQFKINDFKRIMPETQKGLISFIQKFVKGIGKSTAEKIVLTFGTDTLRIIENDYKQLATIKGIGLKTARTIHDNIAFNKMFEDVAMFIIGHGGNFKLAIRVFEELKEESLMKITENPYNMLIADKVNFLQVDKIAKSMGISYKNPLRVAEAIKYYLNYDSQNKGNLYLEKNVLYQELNDFLIRESEYKTQLEKKDIDIGFNVLLSKEEIVSVVDDKETCVYLANNYFVEERIVELLKKHLTEFKQPIANKESIDNFLNAYESNFNMKLADNQKNAVHMAVMSGFSILTGGPGTGKTQTINTIINCIKSLKPGAILHLCAPTGKASKRMTELTNLDAFTIHRLIGLNMFDKDSETNEIFGDFVIVDESSMVDAYVFYKLLSSVDENTRLLFVGDHNQLPSVGAGLILRDLIESKKIPVTILDKIFRQAENSQIVMNAHKIIKGIDSKSENGLTFDESKGDFYFINKKNPIDIKETVITSIKRLIKKGYKLSDIQLLLPIKMTDLGVYEFNNQIQDVFNPPTFEKTETRNEHGIIRQYDRVMQTENNYDLDVFNGEVGYVEQVYEDEEGDKYVRVSYDFGEVEYDASNLDDIILANAMTIHKSQGSEFKVVIIVLHEKYKTVLNRNIIYTGITRAKEMVVLIGDKTMLDYAISKEDNVQRNSRIIKKLKSEL